MNIIKTKFGQKIKYFRKLNNLTQEEFAEKIEVNIRQLARIESGNSFVTSETLYKICDSLKIKPNMLFDFSIDNEAENKNDIFIHIDNVDTDSESFIQLVKNIKKISNDKNRIKFLNVALDALSNKQSLEKLKLIIQGFELSL